MSTTLQALALELADWLAAKPASTAKTDLLVCGMPNEPDAEYATGIKNLVPFLYSARASLRVVPSWRHLAQTIAAHREITDLVLSFHGQASGTLEVGNEQLDLKGVQVASLFDGVRTKVNTLTFLTCRIGCAPHHMVSFARRFQARRVVGYTQYLCMEPLTMTVPDLAAAEKVMPLLNTYRGYLPTNFPDTAAKLVQRAGSAHKLDFCWIYFSRDPEIRAPFPIFSGKVDDELLDRFFTATGGKTEFSKATKELIAEATLAVDAKFDPQDPPKRVEIELKP